MQISQQRKRKQPKVTAPFLRIVDHANEVQFVALVEGQSLFLGTGANCGIQLSGDNVRLMHCMFQFVDGQLIVQDWNTEGGTLINNQPVESATVLDSGDELRIGAFRIAVQLEAGDGNGVVTAAEVLEQDEIESVENLQGSDQLELEPARVELEIPKPDQVLPFEELAVPAAADESQVEHEEIVKKEESLEFEDVDVDCLASFVPSTDDLQLLHEEIEHLQRELAQRDEQILQLLETGSQMELPVQSVSEDESERLVVRLEQLVDELDSADRRVLSLEEQLQMSDDANRAEQDERKYLEGWVNEIEQLVSSKVAELNAELSLVQKRADDFKAERDLAIRQVRVQQQSSSAKASSGRVGQEAISELQSQMLEMQDCLNRKEEEIERLRKQPKKFDQSDYEKQIRDLGEKNRELEVETAREKALIARQRAELLQVKNELEQELGKRKVLGEADCRVQAMRQHLREIHEAEAATKKEQFENSLAGRISNLWKRMDS